MSQLPKDDKKRVTIYNVANEAGVSLATVSRVINNSDVVREDTRKKVQDAIIKLGYKPNAVAQGLALKKTTTIALIVPDSSFYYIGKFINGLLDVAKIYKYNITLHTVSAGVNEMNEIVDNVIKSHADGIVIFNEIFSQQDLETINSYQIPMVYLDSKAIGENSCAVYIDYKKAAYEVVNDYLARGISDIAVIDDRKNPLNVSQIVEGVSEAFNEHDMEFNNLVSTPEIYHNSYDYLTNYFAKNKHQLIITYRDSQAIAVLNACNENGINIPNDTELICVRSSRNTDMVRPQISSFEIPDYDVGSLAMRLMTKMLNGDVIENHDIQLNYVYRPKQSTKQ